MKETILLVIFLVAFGLFFGRQPVRRWSRRREQPAAPPASSQRDTSPLAPDVLTQRVDERKAFEQQWFAAAEMVASKTNDPDVRAVIDFLRANVFALEPIDMEQFRILEPFDGKAFPIGLRIILDKDFDDIPGLREHMENGGMAAMFNPSPPFITVTQQPVSELWRGMVFLHEGAHAMSFAMGIFVPLDIPAVMMEEVRVHDFQNRLCSVMGGAAYAQELEKEISRIRDISNTNPDAYEDTLLVAPSPYNEAFETIFGPALSDHERDIRHSSFLLHAQFTLIERRFRTRPPEVAFENKMRCYFSLRRVLVGEIRPVR